MTDQPSVPKFNVFRGLRTRSWRSGNKVSEKAFRRRVPSIEKKGDPNGISIGKEPLDAIWNLNPYGIAQIPSDSMTRIKDLEGQNLRIVWDSEKHGNIANVPYWDPDLPQDNLRIVEDILTALANISTLVLEDIYQQALAEKTLRKAAGA